MNYSDGSEDQQSAVVDIWTDAAGKTVVSTALHGPGTGVLVFIFSVIGVLPVLLFGIGLINAHSLFSLFAFALISFPFFAELLVLYSAITFLNAFIALKRVPKGSYFAVVAACLSLVTLLAAGAVSVFRLKLL